MLATLNQLQYVFGTEGFFLSEIRDLVLTFDREGEIVFCVGAFYIGHQIVVQTEHFLEHVAKFWDEGLAARLDERFQELEGQESTSERS